jgi:cell division protein ZapA
VSATKSSVKVTILGEEFTIRSDVAPEQTKAVAEYLDTAIKQVVRVGKVGDQHKAAILAALQITNELFEAREASAGVTEAMSELSDDIRKLLPPAKRG